MISIRHSRTGVAALLFIIIVASTPAISAEANDNKGKSPWSIFYSLSFRGYADKTVFDKAPVTDIAVGIEPFQWDIMIPAFAVHLYFPTFDLTYSSIRLGASVDAILLQPNDSASPCILGRDSVWAPRVRLAFGSRLSDLSDTFLMFTASPLGIFDGSGYYYIGAVDIAFGRGMDTASWGIGLCDFIYFIH